MEFGVHASALLSTHLTPVSGTSLPPGGPSHGGRVLLGKSWVSENLPVALMEWRRGAAWAPATPLPGTQAATFVVLKERLETTRIVEGCRNK